MKPKKKPSKRWKVVQTDGTIWPPEKRPENPVPGGSGLTNPQAMLLWLKLDGAKTSVTQMYKVVEE